MDLVTESMEESRRLAAVPLNEAYSPSSHISIWSATDWTTWEISPILPSSAIASLVSRYRISRIRAIITTQKSSAMTIPAMLAFIRVFFAIQRMSGCIAAATRKEIRKGARYPSAYLNARKISAMIAAT